MAGEVFKYLCRPIGGTIIDDNHFVIVIILLQQGGHTTVDIAFLVACWHDNRDRFPTFFACGRYRSGFSLCLALPTIRICARPGQNIKSDHARDMRPEQYMRPVSPPALSF